MDKLEKLQYDMRSKHINELLNLIKKIDDMIAENVSELKNYGDECNNPDDHYGVAMIRDGSQTFCLVCGGEVN